MYVGMIYSSSCLLLLLSLAIWIGYVVLLFPCIHVKTAGIKFVVISGASRGRVVMY